MFKTKLKIEVYIKCTAIKLTNLEEKKFKEKCKKGKF